jgi:hypothetical protein
MPVTITRFSVSGFIGQEHVDDYLRGALAGEKGVGSWKYTVPGGQAAWVMCMGKPADFHFFALGGRKPNEYQPTR